MFRKVSRTLATFLVSTSLLLISGDSMSKNVVAMQKNETVNGIVLNSNKETEIDANKEIECIIEESLKKEYSTGWTTTSVNVRKGPGVDYDILEVYSFNEKVEYADYDDNWVEIKYGDLIAYMCKHYISKTKKEYREFDVPYNSGFKSFMDYRCITATGSKQYQLQHTSAYTGTYGIRQINGRYCVAIGSHFTTEIGKYFDLILENGTIIPCVLGDAKADKDTDSSNIITEHNGCLSEFVVDTNSLHSKARQMGDISYCNNSWQSPVKKIRVYN